MAIEVREKWTPSPEENRVMDLLEDALMAAIKNPSTARGRVEVWFDGAGDRAFQVEFRKDPEEPSK